MKPAGDAAAQKRGQRCWYRSRLRSHLRTRKEQRCQRVPVDVQVAAAHGWSAAQKFLEVGLVIQNVKPQLFVELQANVVRQEKPLHAWEPMDQVVDLVLVVDNQQRVGSLQDVPAP
ncbi:uncharacterized protein LOC144123274 [Amblyomma americanum]